MIRKDARHGLALPEDALNLPEGLDISTIRDWTDYGIWGLLLYDEQPPWFTLIECMHILFHRRNLAMGCLFSPPSVNHQDQSEHEFVRYEVPLNWKLRHLLFRDLETAQIATEGSRDPRSQWQSFFERTSRSASDLNVSYSHLQDVFRDVESLNRALDLLRSTEVEAFSSKRWTSRHLLPLGPDMLFADVREGAGTGDRRFMRRSGELLYLMLGRSTKTLRDQLDEILRKRLLNHDTPWNKFAKLIRMGRNRSEPSEEQTIRLATGYLPLANLSVYDYLAEDWISLLKLSQMQIADLLDPLMRLSALHLVIYMLHRAQATKGGNQADKFPPFVFDLAGSARRNPVQRISYGQFGSHFMLPREAIDAYIDGFAESDYWTSGLDTSMKSLHAANTLRDMFRWPKGGTSVPQSHDAPSETLAKFRASTLASSKHSIWAAIINHTKGAGMALAQRGAGTWYAPNDEFLEALVLANVTDPLELGEFLRRLFSRYRIVIGQEQAQEGFGSDAAMSLEQLKVNEQRLEYRLHTLGYIDRKSDACAFVVNPFYDSDGEHVVETT